MVQDTSARMHITDNTDQRGQVRNFIDSSPFFFSWMQWNPSSSTTKSPSPRMTPESLLDNGDFSTAFVIQIPGSGTALYNSLTWFPLQNSRSVTLLQFSRLPCISIILSFESQPRNQSQLSLHLITTKTPKFPCLLRFPLAHQLPKNQRPPSMTQKQTRPIKHVPSTKSVHFVLLFRCPPVAWAVITQPLSLWSLSNCENALSHVCIWK